MKGCHPSTLRHGAAAWTVAAFVALALLLSAMRSGLDAMRGYEPAFAVTAELQEEINASAFALILGEIRASMADMMWVKTERYLHKGVAYAPHLDTDAMVRDGRVEHAGHAHHDKRADHDEDDVNWSTLPINPEALEHDHHHGEEEEHVATIIPQAQRDFRGWIGRLHREVQPWLDPSLPHVHADGDELLPWYRLMTYSNPKHWRGYMIGTWWLSKHEDGAALEMAETFLEEGIRNNPESFQLLLMRGRLLIQREQWAEALETFQRAADVAMRVRPEMGELKAGVWSESDEEDFTMVLRYVPLIQFRRFDDIEAARASLAAAREILPEDAPLGNLQRILADTE